MCHFAPDLKTSQIPKTFCCFDSVHVIALALMEESAHMGCQDAFISKLVVVIVGKLTSSGITQLIP